jgi:hypothetical protein
VFKNVRTEKGKLKMGIQTDTAFAQPGSTEPRGAAAAAASNRTQGWSFMSSPGLAGISRRATSEALTKAHDAFFKQLTDSPIPDRYAVTLLKVDNTKQSDLRLSAIIPTIQHKGVDNVVAYHTVLLEGSSDSIPSRSETINGKPVTIRRYAADVYNDRYKQAVRDYVASMNPGCRVIDCSGCVLPNGFNFEDKDAVRDLVINAVLPAVSELNQLAPDYVEVNLALLERDCSLQAAVAFNETTRTDYAGLPVRNDISITLQAVSNERVDGAELNNPERSVTLARIGGFIDMIWAPEQDTVTNYAQINPMQNRKFAARMVLTSLENQQGYSIENQLLALAAALTLGEGTNWYPAFSPRITGGGNKTLNAKIDTRDIGALNIEANVFDTTGQGGYGQAIDTKASSFSPQDQGRFIGLAIRPGLTFSIDVSDCGADTWYNEVFSAAVKGDPGAINAILEAANTLTNGAFARHYGNGGSPLLNDDDRVLMGYFIGADGQKHDIREVDHLFVLNYLGAKDPTAAQAWSDTITRTDFPLALRLEDRERQLQEIIGSQITFTQQARRGTFTRPFLEAFAKGIAESGVLIKPVNPAMHGDYINARGSASNLINQAALGTGSLGYFSQGYAGNTPTHTYRSNVNSRWS